MDFQNFIDNHIKILSEGDAERLVENDYHDDAVMVLMLGEKGQIVTGKEALKIQFDMYLKNIYRGFVSIQKLGISDDSICMEATINTTAGEAKVWDALFMKDGKIYRHYSGLK
ncbi:MAG: nuclear transport factor 2 family protein [Desulfuromonadaceae bacterium]|nr:nuclear transport factor 2 family protein [Desulfuromonadaceae bacterium]MDD2855855.1 nuclear transport factor 2 family protein [Desulfuromonadaceae bacterium]